MSASNCPGCDGRYIATGADAVFVVGNKTCAICLGCGVIWPNGNADNREAEIAALRARCEAQEKEYREALDAVKRELAAYKKAKQENDERYMLERDEARAKLRDSEAACAALIAALERAERIEKAAQSLQERNDTLARAQDVVALVPIYATREDKIAVYQADMSVALAKAVLRAALAELKAKSWPDVLTCQVLGYYQGPANGKY